MVHSMKNSIKYERTKMRLDKFLCQVKNMTRTEAKNYIKKGCVRINDIVVKSADCKVAEEWDHVTLNGEILSFSAFYYYILHKPAGVVTATRDNTCKTVMDLLKDAPGKDLFPVGRLDKDTEGLLLITNDGALSHKLLSPKKHVDKTYLVKSSNPVSKDDVRRLCEGVDIGDEKPTLPAKVEILSETELLLTIREGRFHQIKRMLQAVNNEVIYLKRLSMGPLHLPDGLEKGTYRPLSEEELMSLKNN